MAQRHHPGHPLADEKGWVELNDDYWNNLPDVNSCGKPYYASEKAINIISDQMGDIRHMANGKTYDSKSEFRKATRAAGCIEVGNDPSVMNPKPKQFISPDRARRREDIKRSIYEIKNNIRRD